MCGLETVLRAISAKTQQRSYVWKFLRASTDEVPTEYRRRLPVEV